MKVPLKARYEIVMQAVSSFFVNENITSFPIDPFELIRKNRWGLCTYSVLARENNITVEDVIEAYQTEDACVIRTKKNYTIAYNDTIESSQRIRFTLMHEIGHIKLNHLVDFKETTLRRGGLTEFEYDILEREANAFARNALSPPFLVSLLTPKLEKSLVNDISGCFSISLAATRTRLSMLNWDSKHMERYTPSLLVRFQGYLNGILNSKQCIKCHHYFISRFAKHCPICSNTKFLKKREVNYMIYFGYVTNNEGRAVNCPLCSNEEIKSDDMCCKICSSPVVNKCSKTTYDSYNDEHWECGTIADGNARYCTKCGEPTVFFEKGLLKSWEEELKDQDKERQNKLELEFSGIPF